MNRYLSLDAFRGLACLMVVVVHSTLYVSAASVFSVSDPASWLITAAERLWVGVPMFFVISGYCIAATAETSVRRGHRTADYFTRRLRRIFPPYLIAVGIIAPAVVLAEWLHSGWLVDAKGGIGNPLEMSAWQWLGTLTLTERWRPHFIGPREGWLFGTAWTLGYEEQFYAVTGLLLSVAPKRIFTGAALVSVAVVGLLPFRESLRGFFFDGYWLHFAAGILVYWTVNKSWQSRVFSLGILAVATVTAGSHLNELLVDQVNSFRQASVIAFLFAGLLIVLKPIDQSIASHRLMWPLNKCGQMCYSLYLAHWPICKLVSHALFAIGLRSPTSTMIVTVPLCIVLSLAAGWLFHVFVERRFLNSAA